MDSMENFRKRFEALEQQTEQLKHQTHTLARQARWWRGIACGLGLLGLVSLPLHSGTAADTQPRGMAERMATVEKKLSAMTFDDAANEVVITGANLRVVNGLGSTNCLDAQGLPIPNCPNGLGNLIVGYNESRQELVAPGVGPVLCEPERPFCQDRRTGSHNVVVGRGNNFSQFGGLVVGDVNEISGEFASVSGGTNHTASGSHSSISGGNQGIASGGASSISGGLLNSASGLQSSISGGVLNRASGSRSSVSGGQNNTASGLASSVSGGENNTASGDFASVSGGSNRSAPDMDNWAAGHLFADN
jgi:hypothetical protein